MLYRCEPRRCTPIFCNSVVCSRSYSVAARNRSYGVQKAKHTHACNMQDLLGRLNRCEPQRCTSELRTL